jgi:hypothetical protein
VAAWHIIMQLSCRIVLHPLHRSTSATRLSCPPRASVSTFLSLVQNLIISRDRRRHYHAETTQVAPNEIQARKGSRRLGELRLRGVLGQAVRHWLAARGGESAGAYSYRDKGVCELRKFWRWTRIHVVNIETPQAANRKLPGS